MKKRMLYAAAVLALVLGLALPMAAPVMASEIELAKNTDPLSPGKYYLWDEIHFTLRVANPSSNNWTNYLDEVYDILPDGITKVTLATNVTQLPGESNTYDLYYTVNPADLQDVGDGRWRVVNVLRVEGTDSDGDIIDATTSKGPIILRAALNITKTVDFDNDTVFTDSETYYAGEPADWKIIVSNNSFDPVLNIYVSDDNNGTNFYGPFDLNPGESENVPVYTTYPMADFLNTACAQGEDEIGGIVGPVCDPAEVFVIAPDTITTIDASAYLVSSGDSVTLTVTEHNSGDDPLTSPRVEVKKNGAAFTTLDKSNSPGGDGGTPGVLDVGETWTWSGINSGPITALTTFEAVGFGTDSFGSVITYDPIDHPNERDTVDVNVIEPDTRTTIDASETLVDVGASVTLTVTEYNSGGDPLDNCRVEVKKNGAAFATLDETSGSWSSDGNTDAVLDVGETWTWTIDSGPINAETKFEVVGFGTDSLGNVITYDPVKHPNERDDVTIYVRGEACLVICKFQDANVNGMWDPGEPWLPDWKFHVTGPAGYDKWVTTGDDGCVELLDIVSGTYTVTEELKAGWYNTRPGGDPPYEQDVIVGAGPDCARVEFGNREEIKDIPPQVPAINKWGIIAMITVFAGLVVWTVRRKRLASRMS